MAEVRMGVLRIATCLLLLLLIVEQTESQQRETLCVVDVVFVIDNSGSIDDEDLPGQPVTNWQLILNFVSDLVAQFNVGPQSTHVGLVDFGNAAYLEFNLTTYENESQVLAAVQAINYRGEFTNTTGGLEVAYTMLTDPAYGGRGGAVPRDIVLITDGIPNLSVAQLPGVVAEIKNAGIRIVTVGISPQVNTTLLLEIATSPADFTQVSNEMSLATVANLIINNDTCRTVFITTTSTTTTTTRKLLLLKRQMFNPLTPNGRF